MPCFGFAAAGTCGFLRLLRFKLPVRARKRWSNAETKTVIAAYERCLASGDMDGLAVLRQAIEGRIDELESFYTAHLDDERSILFDKQRMKLRKLLHEYDQAVASLQQQGYAPPGSAQSSPVRGGDAGNADNNGGSVQTRQISEGSRLTFTEIGAWFSQAGQQEMPEVTLEVLQSVFRNVTRTNLDGKISIRDLRQWYISYGKRALRAGIARFDGELVPSAMVKPSTAAAREGARKPVPAVKSGLYPWEQQAAAGSAQAPSSTIGNVNTSSAASVAAAQQSSSAAAAASSGPLGLPNAMLEFQVRLTPEEFKLMSLRRRQYESEIRFRERIAIAAQAKQAPNKQGGAGKGKGGLFEADEDVNRSHVRDTPYQDAGSSYLFRTPAA